MNNRDYVSRALELTIDGIGPFVTSVMTPLIPSGTSWTDVLEARDAVSGVRGKIYKPNDLQALLRMLTERLGKLGYPFSERLSRTGQNLASELRETRNNWAHNAEFSVDDTLRTLDSVERLMRLIGAESQAEITAALRADLRSSAAGIVAAEVATTDAGPGADVPSFELAEDGGSEKLDSHITIAIETVPVLSYAAAHNRVPVISSVTISNAGPARRGAVIKFKATHALGRVSQTSEQLVDLAADSSVTLSNSVLYLDPARMLAVEERRPAAISARIEVGGEVVAKTRVNVDLLAAHQWVSQPLHLSLELLAAFVLPNHPSITILLSEASDILVAKTGDGSLQGYQSGEERVDQIVEAIFLAMQNRRIRYSEPPASWGDQGQKVRTPGEVLEGRIGTCLDTTVVMAAAMEQAGIKPLLWVVSGHAFVGYWRDEDGSVGSAATTEGMQLANFVDLKLIGLVETTMITERAEQLSFYTATRDPIVKWIEGAPQKILGITDVVAARLTRIFPIPAQTIAEDGTTIVTEYRPAVTPEQQYAEFVKTTPKDSTGMPTVPYRVTQWKNSLLDLSLRNRLINFTERGRLSMAVPDSDVGHLEDLINAGKQVSLAPSDEVAQIERERGTRYGRDLPEAERTALLRNRSMIYADVTEAAYTTRLRNLAYKAKTITEETGANNLYLAFGTLVWKFNDKELRSPLVLVPVNLEPGRGGRYQMILDESGTSTPNYCLIEKLRQVHGLEIPGLAEPPEDGSGIDLDGAFRATREALASAGLPYRVEASVDLSILQFAKFRLWKDLDENWHELAKNSLVRHLIDTPNESYIDPIGTTSEADLDDLSALCPVPADSSQLAAIAAAVSDQTFVLEGPPGTGKSQTITNLLVRAVADGKRVLFVAEKRAALQVVQRRLEEVGLGAFALDLHDKGSRPNAVRAQIKAALQHRATADDDGLRIELDTLTGARRTLSRYAGRLHEPNKAGLSFYSARNSELAEDHETPVMQVPHSLVASGTAAVFDELRALLRNLPDIAEPARPQPHHPWSFVQKVVPGTTDKDQIVRATEALDKSLADLPRSGPLFVAMALGASGAEFQALAYVAEAERVSLPLADMTRSMEWRAQATAALKHLDHFLAEPRTDVAVVDPGLLLTDLPSIHAAALEADTSKFIGRRRRRRAVRDMFSASVATQALPKLRAVSEMTGMLLGWHSQIAALKAEFSSVPGLEQPVSWNPILEVDGARLRTRVEWLNWLGRVLDPVAAERSSELSAAIRDYYGDGDEPQPDNGDKLVVAGTALETLASSVGATSTELEDVWAVDEQFLPKWIAGQPAREAAGTAALVRWMDLVLAIEPLRTHMLLKARSELLTGRLDSEVALAAFNKGVAIASRAERAVTTSLDSFMASTHNRVVGRFSSSADAVRERLVKSIPADLIRRREFDPLSTGGQIGELKRQLERQRGGLGVRALLDRFGGLITQLIPCVLMSPESVARFFGARSDLFDIVVFDEASQVRVADAIGAMGRARSVVVVGDSKQMPPTSFAETNTIGGDDDRGETLFVQDEESILSECVTARVPSRELTWHYRSQDESLISFSNEHYYGNLSSFPSPLHGSADDSINGHGITLVRVQGKFLRSATGKELRTNPVEAEAIVDEIQRRFWGSPDQIPSVGVVTFNAPQRALIESLLRDAGDPRIVEALENSAEGLFVKNLENVQGDERDSILFSTAFSADEKGTLPLNFGPLSQAGGERRLNVAITRARRQVILFSSFDPRDLRAEQSTSVGLKHFKAYLELAASSGQPRSTGQAKDETVDRHREEIAEALRSRGFAVTTDVGLSDFRVDLSIATAKRPGTPLVAVLLDNPPWERRRTVADRDGLPKSVLKNLMNWPAVERIWMPEWLTEQDETLARLEASINTVDELDGVAALADDSELEAPEPHVVVETAVMPEPHLTTEAAMPIRGFGRQFASNASPATAATRLEDPLFVPWTARRAGSTQVLDDLPSSRASARVAEIMREIVAAEGPIHYARLAKLVGGAFDLDRVAQTRVARILACLPSELRAADDNFAWPEDMDPLTWDRFRVTPLGTVRPLEHVHTREIGSAMVSLCVRGAGLFEEELRRETLRLFSIIRMTPKMTEILTTAIEQALATNRIWRDPNGLLTVRR